MFNPNDQQIEFEITRLSLISYDTVYKHFNVTQDRVMRVGQLMRKLPNFQTDIKMRYRLVTKYKAMTKHFNDLCNQANGTPLSY